MIRAFQQGDEPVRGYRLVNYLGKGSFGDVWQATGPGGTEVAFKIIKLDSTPGMKNLRAVELLKKIRHPNLCSILAIWIRSEEGVVTAGDDRSAASTRTQTLGEMQLNQKESKAEALYLAMGLAEMSLLDRFKDCKELGQTGIPTMELIGYFEDASRGIDFLNSPRHDLGQGLTSLPHCDIKPQNLLIVGGAAQVCDFGLANVLRGPGSTATSNLSAAFTAPELLDGGEPNAYSDQYSLAITYHYLRTGALPFSMTEPSVVLTEALEGKLNLSRLTTAEQQVIRRATSRRPEARFANCQDLTRELRRAIERSGTVPVDGLVIEPNREIVPGHKLITLLGRGAYGEVWQALAPGRLPIALKIIKDLDRVSGRGRQEFRALEIIQSISHNALMELRSYWLLDRHGQPIPDEQRGHPNSPVPATLVIATKLADKNLTQVLNYYKEQEDKPGIPVHELLGYMHQVAGALDYLNQPRHKLGNRLVSIQHRDVKPDNIMLARDAVKLTDFGLAKVLETDSSAAEIQQDSVGFTFHYAAPEVLRGKVTKWSDQYSLAITYFQLRTGQLPYGIDCSAYDQMMRQLEGQLDLSPLLPAERKVIARATSVIPEERFPSCQALLEALTKAVPASGELLNKERDEVQEARTPPLSKALSSFTLPRKKDPPSDLIPVSPPVKAGHRRRTMHMILNEGEVYPPPIKKSLIDNESLREGTDQDSGKADNSLLNQDEHARKPGEQYFLPLAIVFVVGIVTAGLVPQFVRGPASIAQSTSPEVSPLDDRPYEFVGPKYEEQRQYEGVVNVGAHKLPGNASNIDYTLPAPSAAKPPDLLIPTSTTPVPEPIFVMGRSISDPTFPSFLQTSLDRMIAGTTIPVQFSRSLRELERVPTSFTSAKLLAFRAECLLEGENKNVPLADAYIRQASELREPSAYVQYVQARTWQELRDPARAVAALEESLKRDISLAGFRRDRAVSIFEEAAQRVNIVTDANNLSAAVASPVPSWLVVAERYVGKAQGSSALAMLLAIMNPAPKDPALLQPVLTASVQEEWSRRPQGPLLLTSLRLKQIDAAMHAKQTNQALGMYSDTLTYIMGHREAFAATNPLVLYYRILAPAQQLAASIKPNPMRNTQLASILATQGELIYETPNEAWPLPANKPPLRMAAEAYGEAAKLHPGTDRTKAEYLNGQVQCLLRLGSMTPSDIAIITANATAATNADRTFTGGWNLMGLARYYLISQGTSEEQLRQTLNDSIAAYDKAINLAGQVNVRDRQLAQYRSNRSLAKSMLGDWTPVENDQRRLLYQDAITDALKATELEPAYDSAWGAVGQARERLADLLNGVPARTVFPEAVAAYRKQLESRPSFAQGSTDLGRCLIRWAMAENNDPVKLDQGREELNKAIKLDDNLAEAHYWLGRYYQMKNDTVRANESFQKASKAIDAALPQAPLVQKLAMLKLKSDIQSKVR